MKFTYYILSDVVQNRPNIEQFELSLDDLGEKFSPDEVKKSCKCCFLDVNLEPQEILDYDQNQEILDLLTILDVNLDTFEEIIEEDPEFIPAYNRLGWLESDNYNYGNALSYFMKSYKIGNKLIPTKFNGQIHWGE